MLAKSQIVSHTDKNEKEVNNIRDLKSLSINKDINNNNSNLPTPLSSKSKSNWVYLQSKAVASNGAQLVVDIFGARTTPGTKCTAYQMDRTANNQFFQFSKDGHIISVLNGNYCLDIDPNTNSIIMNDWSNSYTQIWSLNSLGQLVNGSSPDLCLGMAGAIKDPIIPNNPNDLIVGKPISNDNICFQWVTSPGFPLDSILSQTAQPFPQYQGNQLKAFKEISQALAPGVDNIRLEYTNLAVSLSFYQILLQNIPYPSYLTHGEFDDIKLQITYELGYSQAIINLFNNYRQFHNSLFSDNSARLNQLSILCQMEKGSENSVGGTMLQLFNGILYAILSAIPGGGIAIAPIIGNLMEMGINVGLSASSSYNSISPDPFQVTVSNLWNKISTNFEALLASIGEMETMILQDWGKMQSVYQLIVSFPSNPNSLAWTTTTTGNLIKSSVPGYENSLLQILMRSKYQIYKWEAQYNNDTAMINVPEYCLFPIGNGDVAWIADANAFDVSPTEDLMNLIWNNKVDKKDFFLSRNGWNFPTALLNNIYWMPTPTISNNTSIAMLFDVTYNNITSPSQEVATYSSVVFPIDYQRNNNIDYDNIVNVYDLNKNLIATFTLHREQSGLEGGYVSITNKVASKGYFIGYSQCNPGNHTSSYTPSINIPIYEDPNN